MSLKEYYISGDVTQSAGYTTHMAQTFKASSDYTIASVRLLVYKLGNPGTCTVDIRTTSGGVPTNTVLCSGTFAGSGADIATGSPYTWKEITLGAGADLTSGVTYAISLYGGTNSANTIQWRGDNTSPTYADGQAAFSNSPYSSWSALSGTDRMFKVYDAEAAVYHVAGEISGISSFTGEAYTYSRAYGPIAGVCSWSGTATIYQGVLTTDLSWPTARPLGYDPVVDDIHNNTLIAVGFDANGLGIIYFKET